MLFLERWLTNNSCSNLCCLSVISPSGLYKLCLHVILLYWPYIFIWEMKRGTAAPRLSKPGSTSDCCGLVSKKYATWWWFWEQVITVENTKYFPLPGRSPEPGPPNESKNHYIYLAFVLFKNLVSYSVICYFVCVCPLVGTCLSPSTQPPTSILCFMFPMLSHSLPHNSISQSACLQLTTACLTYPELPKYTYSAYFLVVLGFSVLSLDI